MAKILTGQANWFMTMAPIYSSYAQKRYKDETTRYFSIVEKRLLEHDWLVGDKYTIADIAWYTWMRMAPGIIDLDISVFPKTLQWIKRISEREAVKRARRIPETGRTEEEVMAMFAQMRKNVLAQKSGDGV